MFSELLEIAWDFIKKIITSRLFALAVLFTVMFTGLIGTLFRMQILEGNQYQDEYMQMTEQTVTTPGIRGNIYDRNGYPLAYNELAYSVTIQDLGDYPRPEDRNAMIYRLVTILNRRGETVEGKFEIAMDADGEMAFTCSSDSAKTRFLLNFYGLSSSDQLDDARGRYPSDVTAYEAFEYKKKEYELDQMKDEKGNALILPDATALDMINIIYTMNLTRYQKYVKTTVASNISEETMMEINENIADLKGVAVEQAYIRRYADSVYFAPIIGYTGKVQEDQLDALNEEWRATADGQSAPVDTVKYDLNDVVGRSGIEQSMELELQGDKGFSRMYVDNMGRPREIIENEDAQAGNDVYLTIDRDLQVAIYHLIEQQLAGILVKNLVNEDVDKTQITDSSKVPIPVKDAYYQLINNNVLSLDHMAGGEAAPIEQEIYSIYLSAREQILGALENELLSAHASTMNELSADMYSYMNYIYTYLSDSSVGIIQRDKIDQNSDTFAAWREGNLSLRDYILSGIAQGWVDTTKLGTEDNYSGADEIFAQLTDYIIQSLQEDTQFTKLMFRYLVNNGQVTGRQLCLALFAQGVLAEDPQWIAQLQAGDESTAFAFIRQKISNIELTPAQLALDPCTGGCVVTDVKTGEVLALVTYPSYDNNEMSGSVDPEYYAKLQNDLSRPLYNNATQARKAPGSTFKPLIAVAALEEGVVTLDETINCTGRYEEVDRPIRCTGHHGEQTVIEGIQNSCNYVFAELAHRLCMDENGVYSAERGLSTIQKYAVQFGLSETSGVEIPENDPQISNTDPERSAMGQGTHNYANVQLARYVAAIANRGTLFKLSLLDKLTDSDGNLLTDYTPEAESQIEVADSTWDAVQEGMRRVISVTAARIYSDLPVEVAGKTGTSQEDRTRANHGFFISFAPYSSPEIAVTVNIPYGYAGTNAATLGKNVYEYYYGYTTLEEILGSGASGISNVTIND